VRRRAISVSGERAGSDMGPHEETPGGGTARRWSFVDIGGWWELPGVAGSDGTGNGGAGVVECEIEGFRLTGKGWDRSQDLAGRRRDPIHHHQPKLVI
jgi:hypothetical protein